MTARERYEKAVVGIQQKNNLMMEYCEDIQKQQQCLKDYFDQNKTTNSQIFAMDPMRELQRLRLENQHLRDIIARLTGQLR